MVRYIALVIFAISVASFEIVARNVAEVEMDSIQFQRTVTRGNANDARNIEMLHAILHLK